MCRWLAYTGNPVPLDVFLYRADNSLIDQSLHSHMGATTTNGDGFGMGWYTEAVDFPTRYRSVHPAWNDRNLRELACAIASPLFLAHIRSSTGTPVQETNCHPFRHGKWLFMHNGSVREFSLLRRDLLLAVDPALFPAIEGSTDSELLFFLALTFGLALQPVQAIERMAGLVEDAGRRHGVEQPLNMTVCATDGEQIIAARYSSERASRSLFCSTSIRDLQELYPDEARFAAFGNDARMVVSEPLGHLPGAWNEVPEASVIVVRGGVLKEGPFVPIPPG